MEEFKDRYIADALDLLSRLERSLLLLEVKPDNILIVEEIFRGLHSLKGASGMYGFQKIGALMHIIESVYEGIRDTKIKVDNNIINLSLSVVDFTTKVLKMKDDVSDSSIAEYNKLKQHINSYLKLNTEAVNEGENTEIIDEQVDKTYYVSFSLNEEFEQRGIKLDSVFRELDKLGSIISIPIKDKKNSLNNWEIFIVSKSPLTDIEDAFIFMLDIVRIELLANRNLFLNDDFNAEVKKNSSLKKPNDLELLKTLTAKIENEQNKQSKELASEPNDNEKQSAVSFLRVSSEKLDEQMDLLSELVTAKAELQLIVEKEGYKKLFKLIESVDKITNRFRKNILNVRLVQIKTLYVMFLRLIRDISQKLDKDVEFVAEGLETELDKNIIDSLESPLTHLIRNSLDHGIESITERKNAGKSPKGKIAFNVHRSGSDIIIEIKDDGRGIDKDKIREKAIEKGLINADTPITDKQLYDLIFLPGFSTAQNLSDVSGRGVGMDVVKKSINQLRGEIAIKSEKGKSTSMLIKLPLSLSIIDTLLVESGNHFFSIPLPDIQKCSQITIRDLEQTDNNQLVIEGKLLPYIHLRKLFHVSSQLPDNQKVVVVTNGFQEVGLVVDRVVGEYQAVLKPFDGYIINQQFFSGASLLADGQLAVILDISKLIDYHNEFELTNTQ